MEQQLDDEIDLDLEAGAKLLIGQNDNSTKKKSKTKARKNKKVLETKITPAKNTINLPLSLLDGTAADKAQYELKLTTQKNNLKSAKEYKTTEKFKTGDIIEHKTFGIGFVIVDNYQNKIEVLFQQGRKLLACGLK